MEREDRGGDGALTMAQPRSRRDGQNDEELTVGGKNASTSSLPSTLAEPPPEDLLAKLVAIDCGMVMIGSSILPPPPAVVQSNKNKKKNQKLDDNTNSMKKRKKKRGQKLRTELRRVCILDGNGIVRH
jgi:hypothetical protein